MGFDNVSLSDISTINASCIYQTLSSSFNSINYYLSSHFEGHAGMAPGALGGSTEIATAIFNMGNVSTTVLDSHFRMFPLR